HNGTRRKTALTGYVNCQPLIELGQIADKPQAAPAIRLIDKVAQWLACVRPCGNIAENGQANLIVDEFLDDFPGDSGLEVEKIIAKP
ncbi:hypothetical protein NZA98_02685, partial [Escherichia coli]|nr:hypothetical protein [Escherichia coli]